MTATTSVELVDTPVGRLHRGDVVHYRSGNEIDWAVVSGRSSLNPSIVFARNSKGRAKVINIESITRITPAR